MPKRELSVLASGYTYLEGLRWRDGRLWASDFYTEQVIAVDLEGASSRSAGCRSSHPAWAGCPTAACWCPP